MRRTATAAAAAASAQQQRAALASTRPKRTAAIRAAVKAAAAGAADDSAAPEPELPVTHKRGRGRPRLSEAEKHARKTAKAAARTHNILVASITVANQKQDIDETVVHAFNDWLKQQVAGAAPLERGGTYGHLHIQSVAKVYATTPKEANRLIKVTVANCCNVTHDVLDNCHIRCRHSNTNQPQLLLC